MTWFTVRSQLEMLRPPASRYHMVLRFNIYGRFKLEVRRESGTWVAYRADLGKRFRIDDLAIPADLAAEELVGYLDAFYHEYAEPGQNVELLR